MTTVPFQPPSPLQPTALIDSADDAVNNAAPGSPSRETIHRAVSTAYYAVFHAINASNAAVQHGAPADATAAEAWTNTYRQMRHNFAARSLDQHLSRLTSDAGLLADRFTRLKTARETADYDPTQALTAVEANYWIGEARTALSALQAMTAADRQILRNITLTGNP